MRRLLVLLLASVLLQLCAPAQESLELGKMWTFENAPKDYFKRVHGFDLTQEWLDAVRLASLRFGNGCSASFVSPNGLVMTNHHCARGQIAAASPADQDWVKDGFVAGTMVEEVKLDGLAVQQLVAMHDETTAMNQGLDDAVDDDAVDARRKQNETAILERYRQRYPGLEPQMVMLYQGGMFQVYVYKIYTDIRLVCAPHLQTSHFGGDPDNFTYPRYAIDFAFCRAYEGDRPADTSAHYFRWNSRGIDEGESVFITGNPGSTDRLMTVAQLEFTRDVRYPLTLDVIDQRLEALMVRAAESEEAEKEVRPRILSLQNAQKAYRGYLSGLLDASLMEQKREWETELRAEIAANPELERRFGSAWERLAEITRARRVQEPRRRHWDDLGIPLLARARLLMEAVDPDSDDPKRAAAREQLLAHRLHQDEAARALTLERVHAACEWLGEHDPYLALLLGGKDAERGLFWLIEASPLKDRAQIETLLEGGAAAVAASDDPALRAVRFLDDAKAKQAEEEVRLAAAERVQKARIGQAVFAVYGTSVSPDATFSLRLSDGVVAGFPCNGTIAPPWTTFYGLYGRNVEFRNQHPFDLPAVWLEKQHDIDLRGPINFVATNDIIGGNSGSPVINARRQIVGLVFDGNIEMLPNRFLYRDDIPRSVSVHADAIMQALTGIYGAHRIAAELRGQD